MSFNNEAFKQALAAFATSVPSDVKDFCGGGVRISSAKVPRAALPSYRPNLDYYIARAIKLDQDNVA